MLKSALNTLLDSLSDAGCCIKNHLFFV